MGTCTSTNETQTKPAPAITSVYVHSLAHPVRTKIYPGSPVVNHAPVVLSVLRVPPVVCLMLQVVRLVLMPVEQRRVILVRVENTTIKLMVKHWSLVAKPAEVESTTIKLDKHQNPVVKSVIQDCTKTTLDKYRVKYAPVLGWLHWIQDALTSECTRNERVESVGTVVVVGAKLCRVQRVERVQLR